VELESEAAPVAFQVGHGEYAGQRYEAGGHRRFVLSVVMKSRLLATAYLSGIAFA
jgi:hypothetical protein